MKIHIECKDIMLQKTMELFLKEYMTSKKDCDFLVCDEKTSYKKAQFIVGDKSFLKLPFSKEKLLEALSEFYSVISGNANMIKQSQISAKNNTQKENEFEEKLDILMNSFKKSLIELFKEYKG